MAANSQTAQTQRDTSASNTAGSRNGSCPGDSARSEREEKLERYLRGVIDKGYASQVTVATACSAWNDLDAATGRQVPIPNAGPGPNGEVIFTWDRNEHHFELEVSPAEPPYLFYRNRESELTWGADFEPGQTIPADAVRHLLSLAS
jgi:hypothetical protein